MVKKKNMEENTPNAHYFSEYLKKKKHHYVRVLFSEKNSYSQVNCFAGSMI